MSTLKRISSVSLALLLATSFSASEAEAQRRGISPSMGRSLGAPGLSRSSGLSRSMGRSSIGVRSAGPSMFIPGPSPGLRSSFGPSRSLYSSRRPSTGLSLSIGSGYSPSLRYGSFGRGYGMGYSYPYSLSPYSSSYGRYNSGFGYSPYSYSARPSIGLSIYSSPLLYSQPYSSTSSTYRYTQPYTSSPYQSYREPAANYAPQYDAQSMNNPYAQTSSMQPEHASGDPSDPSTELRAGMILPDGSRVISVGAIPAAGTTPQQPSQPMPTQSVPVETAEPSVLEQAPAQPVPSPAIIEPAKADEEGDVEELPAGNVTRAKDV